MKLVFLIAHQRSGTNAIRSAMHQSRLVEDLGEAFNPEGTKYAPNLYHFMRLDDNLELWKPGNNLTRFLKYYKYLSDLADRNIGLIDVKYDMLRAFDPEVSELYSYPALFDMVDKVGASVIHLTRNPFQIYVSHRLCVETSVFHLKIGAERQLFDKISRHSISIDIQDMIEYIGKRLEEQADINHYVKFCTHRLSVDYKDLYIENEGMNLDLLWKFMGLAPQECTPEPQPSPHF